MGDTVDGFCTKRYDIRAFAYDTDFNEPNPVGYDCAGDTPIATVAKTADAYVRSD